MTGSQRAILGAAWLVTSLAGTAMPATTSADHGRVRLRVFAAASLGDAFGDLAARFERGHPEVAVQLHFAGSQQLASQIENGAAADIFASADERWMKHLEDAALVRDEPQVFARNRLVVIVPRANPGRIRRLQDLARRGVKVVIGAEGVPVGRYSREVLGELARADGFDPGFARRVLANVVSEEENVKAVLGKVQLGEADAGMVYRSDVSAAPAQPVRVLPIPDSANVLAPYPIAVLKDARAPVAARAFVALVLSPIGQRILERRGLVAAALVPAARVPPR